jgi:multicomponent Na+:H+ antiporter subunit A
MTWLLLLAHLLGCAVAVSVGDRIGRRVLYLAAVPPALTALWASVLLLRDRVVVDGFTWVDGLDLELFFRVGPLAAVMTLVVAGIGTLVFVYAAGYFGPTAEGMGRFAALLLAFAAAMLGLVWAGSLWTLFIFWELTSVTSFLLVGFRNSDAATRLAARRALLITAAGGLALLAATVLLVDAAGTATLADMGAVGGGTATLAAVLMMVAVATKSAQVPFHVWLPGAMSAPTPVSAYLHSATMVKAGVLLVAVVGPVLDATSVWTPLGIGLGGVSVAWGAVGALRHTDAKLILAWGTVSQLGLMIALLAVGTAKATFAAIAILCAHAVFKAALFMVVGEIDVRAGSRNIEELSGLWRSMPVTAAVAVAAGASMAGVPPLMGFPAKEAAVEAVLGLDSLEGLAMGLVVIGGSILTVAYTVRLLVGLLGGDGSAGVTAVAPPRAPMLVPIAVLGGLSFLGYVGIGVLNALVRPAAVVLRPGAAVYSLLRWPGLTDAFLVSVAVVLVGLGVGVWVSRSAPRLPEPRGARAADRLIDSILALARFVTGRIQHGSLPVYVATMAVTASLAATPFLLAVELEDVTLGGTMTVVLGALVVAAAAASLTVSSRLGAALGLGAVGLGVTGVFVIHGAPDLVLTQLLVETVVVVGFVVGLGHLARRFPPVGRSWKGVRIVVSIVAGVMVTAGLLASGSARVTAPFSERIVGEGVDVGGGNNIVNVILTDIRGLDTLGEIVVLVVVGIGVLALAGSRSGHRDPSVPSDGNPADRSRLPEGAA